MEWLTAILASILTVFSSAGILIDSVIAGQIRKQVKEVEQLNVRLDNTPNYQILQGKVDKIRIASRGVYPIAHLRIDTIALETDPLDVDLKRLQGKGNKGFSQALRQSAQGAIKIVLKESDLNLALESPEIKARIQTYINRLLPKDEGSPSSSFELIQARLDFLPDSRIRIHIKLQQGDEPLEMVIESGIRTTNGKNLEIIAPSASLNGRQLSKRLLNGFAEGLSAQLDLGRLEEKDRILARVLQLKIEEQEMTLAVFVRVDPSSREQ